MLKHRKDTSEGQKNRLTLAREPELFVMQFVKAI